MLRGRSPPQSKHSSTQQRSVCGCVHPVQPKRAHKEPSGTSTSTQHSTASAAPALAWPCRGARLLTLERSFGGAVDADAGLWHGGGFAAEVWPDVPIASTWSGLIQNGLARCAAEAKAPYGWTSPPVLGKACVWRHAG